METRSTASSFLLRDGRVLLLHRPGSVRSFPDRWSAVSGKLEDGESAQEAAEREIEEETGYRRSRLRLLATGVPFEAVEEERSVCWRVHPFLWLLQDMAEVRLDEENDAFAWVRFDDLREHPTVPRLHDAFEALRPALPRELTEGERFLRHDRASGARELGARMLGILEEALPVVRTWPQWVFGVMQLGTSRPAMAPLSVLSRRLLSDKGSLGPPEDPAPWMATLSGRDRVEAAETLHQLREELDRAAEYTVRAGASFLAGKRSVVTFSSSSTVREAFRLAAELGGAPRKITLSPAHPLDEGLAQARALRGFGYEVEVVEDEQLATRLRQSDALLLGADAVFPDGSIANRAGSAALAAAARELGVAVVVLADAFKVQPRPELFEGEELVGPGGPQALFETIEGRLVDRILGLDPP